MDKVVVGVLALICAAPAAFTQKYKTEIPPAKFTDGFPDDATVQKVCINVRFRG
jgi:hypothetical protein